MRQIKFRGKDAFQSKYFPAKWREGGLMLDGEDVWLCALTDDKGIISVKVRPDTVGQFTGLLDKNGKEIYEGDILGCPEDNYFLHEAVIFAEGCFMVKDDYTTTPMCAIDAQYRTVIGNVHDTELLNESNNHVKLD